MELMNIHHQIIDIVLVLVELAVLLLLMHPIVIVMNHGIHNEIGGFVIVVGLKFLVLHLLNIVDKILPHKMIVYHKHDVVGILPDEKHDNVYLVQLMVYVLHI